MRNVLVYLLGLTMALWLGGLIALFMFVSTLFMNDRATAVLGAPLMFKVFDRYQLIIAAVAIVTAIGWRFYACSLVKKLLLAFLIAAALLAVIEAGYVAPRLNGSRAVDAETFQRFHVLSRWVYQGIALFVMIGGGLFLRAIQQERVTVYVPRTNPVTEPVAGGQTSSTTAQA